MCLAYPSTAGLLRQANVPVQEYKLFCGCPVLKPVPLCRDTIAGQYMFLQ